MVVRGSCHSFCESCYGFVEGVAGQEYDDGGGCGEYGELGEHVCRVGTWGGHWRGCRCWLGGFGSLAGAVLLCWGVFGLAEFSAAVVCRP